MMYPPTLPDTLLKLVSEDGFSTGEVRVLIRGEMYAKVDASKGNERWTVVAPTRYEVPIELMQQLGWDLEDG